MAARIFLALSVLVWLPYGVYCWLDPGSLASAAGVGSTSPTGSTELRAMYGGLQIAIGLLAGLGVVRPPFVRPALLTLAFLTAGLATARLTGAFVDAGFSSYTWTALAFEVPSAVLAIALLRRPAAAPLPDRLV
jgi:hypothetical protein